MFEHNCHRIHTKIKCIWVSHVSILFHPLRSDRTELGKKSGDYYIISFKLNSIWFSGDVCIILFSTQTECLWFRVYSFLSLPFMPRAVDCHRFVCFDIFRLNLRWLFFRVCDIYKFLSNYVILCCSFSVLVLRLPYKYQIIRNTPKACQSYKFPAG